MKSSPFAPDTELKVRPYDRAASGLIAALVVLATLVTMLLAVWFTSVLQWDAQQVRVEWKFGGDQGEAPSDADDAAPLDVLNPETDFDATMQSVTDVLSQQAAVYATEVSPLDGLSVGNRDGRRPGPQPPGWGPDDRTVRPPWERWEIRFTSTTLEEYRRQLEFFGVELAVFGGNDSIDYASNFLATVPSRRTIADPSIEQRIRFSWRDGALLQYDKSLLQQAGIRTKGRVLCQFYTDEMCQRLLVLEAASGRPPEQWLRTLFGVRPRADGGYEFYVMAQSFLPATDVR